ncbi:MAG: hypothetical protein ACD_50C00377G0004 [uncultured bacterium]|nr:MAG: hypothetical protein ACD_50C00377G0004 [uncultured bacterium]
MVKKITAGVVGGLFLTSLIAASAFADTTSEISGNGAGSINSIYIKNKSNCDVSQKNKTTVLTEVVSKANSGGNNANGNTGGDVTIDTGNASSEVLVSVEGGSNEATDPCCCGSNDSSHEALISGNGRHSINSVTLKNKKSSEIKQKNKTEVLTAILSKAKTGKNRANYNTDGSVEVKTGDADSLVDVSVSSSSNTLNP